MTLENVHMKTLTLKQQARQKNKNLQNRKKVKKTNFFESFAKVRL